MGAQVHVRQAAFGEPAGAATKVQRGSRRDGKQVGAALLQLHQRKHGEAVGTGDRLDARGHELADVLAGDGRVGADVDDVVALVAGALEMVDGLGDHALGDVGLPQAELVGHQEPDRRVFLGEHALEGPHGSSSLEVLEVG